MTNLVWPWQFVFTKHWSWRVTSFTWSLVARLASKTQGETFLSLFVPFWKRISFSCRNETSLVNLELIRGQDKVQQVIYGQEYKLRAYFSQPDGELTGGAFVFVYKNPTSIFQANSAWKSSVVSALVTPIIQSSWSTITGNFSRISNYMRSHGCLLICFELRETFLAPFSILFFLIPYWGE